MTKTTGLASIKEGESTTYKVDPRKIKVRANWNSRNFDDPENAEHVEFIYNSAVECGIKEALTVSWEKDTCWLDDGECRLKAALLVIERTGNQNFKVPVKAEERYASPADRLYNQRIRNGAKPFTIFEDAKHFKRLLDLGEKQEDIAKRCMISPARVSQILEYNTVGTVGREMVANGQASASLVMAVTKEEGTEAEKALLNGVKAAKKAGRTKLKPGDVGGKVSISKLVRECFEYSDVSDEDDEMTLIKMPVEQWNKLREACKL